MTAYWVFSSVLITAFAVKLLLSVFGSKAKPAGRYDRLLDTAAERGQVVTATVVTLEAVRTGKLERERFDKVHTKHYKNKHMLEGAYLGIPDSRTSYRPVLRYSFGGRNYEERYHSFISDRELSLKDGQTVRICVDPDAPTSFVIVGDKASYNFLRQIVK